MAAEREASNLHIVSSIETCGWYLNLFMHGMERELLEGSQKGIAGWLKVLSGDLSG